MQRPMQRPSGSKLWKEYQQFEGNRQPCARGVLNQCAIRMSVALGRSNCDFDFRGWTLGFVHNGGACSELPPHVTSSRNLAHYLQRLGLHFEIYRKSNTLSVADIKQRILGRMGIIFFEYCFGVNNSNSHIDFWNGKAFMNQVLRTSVGGGLPHSTDLFTAAQGRIWFSPTP